MSVRCIAEVFGSGYRRGGNHLLVLVAMADHADDDGANVYPSMASLARKVRCSTVQVRRVVHDLLREGVIELTGNQAGGAPGSTRVYRIRLDRLTPLTDDSRTPLTDDSRTALMDARDGSHGGSRRLSPARGEPSLTVRNQKAAPAAPNRHSPQEPATNPAANQRQPLPATTETRPPPPNTAHSVREIVWGLGVRLLTAQGLDETKARSFLGRMAKIDERKLGEVIGSIATSSVADPRSYIAGAMQPKAREWVG